MIAGIGADLTEISRIQDLLGKASSERFLQRILTPAEREAAELKQGARLAEFVAGRFAAKESVAKALGYGIGAGLSFQDIEIINDARTGKPVCTVREEALIRAGLDHTAKIHLTITHTQDVAAAFVVIEN